MIPLNKEPQKRSQLEKVLEVDFPGVSRASYLREKVVQKILSVLYLIRLDWILLLHSMLCFALSVGL